MENIKMTLSSKVIIDIKLPYHSGLSFRFFESLGYNKKLITNNTSVKEYDFYHPNNIFITDYENFEGLEEFLNQPYVNICEEIKTKYKFENWIKNILKIEE
ncbi:MAG: hypothetical protein Q4A00_06030 [Flavobacteriaceae bacterium]|nr:hypothetical protein [Flavobacteriaceae bacterium]